MKTRFGFALLVAAVLLPRARAEGDVPVIQARPGAPACQAQKASLGSGDVQVQLCVKQGSFAHDEYTVSIDGTAAVKAIDDQTTKGAEGVYKGLTLMLRCEAQERAPDKANPAMVTLLKKRGMSDADAEKMAVRMETVEVGRLCTVREGARELLEVTVKFD